MESEWFVLVWPSEHQKIVSQSYQIKAVMCFDNIGNSTRNHSTDGEDDL